MQLNALAQKLSDSMRQNADLLRIKASRSADGATILDCGVKARGGLEAGRQLAQVCMAGLGWVTFAPPLAAWPGGPSVAVATDFPLAACMASQYAGWQISAGKFFAMGSGPMRAAAGHEALFEEIGHREAADQVVGVLEASDLPTDEACRQIAEKCQVAPDRLTLLVAPTGSQSGSVQIAARSVETALHKLHALGFDLTRVESGFGAAPLPPVAPKFLDAIGRTNDAILYGAETTLWVRGDDASLAALGPQAPSQASRDYGEPFAKVFDRYERDFYKIDPLLFSPAVVTFINLDTGTTLRFGQTRPDVLARSFGG